MRNLIIWGGIVCSIGGLFWWDYLISKDELTVFFNTLDEVEAVEKSINLKNCLDEIKEINVIIVEKYKHINELSNTEFKTFLSKLEDIY